GITAQKVSIVAVLFLVMYALGALTAKKAESVGVSALLHEKSENWGLGFGTEGKPPTGNASAEELKKYNAYFIGDTTQNTIYLTFDCGYENGNTEPILDALKKHDVKATFFVVGNFLETSPEIVKRMIAEGHTVGNHTYHHWDMSKIGEMEQFRQELESLETLYRDTTGQELAKFYRPPQGIYSEKNLEMAQQLGYHTVFWSLAYVDWLQDDQPTSEQAYAKLIPRIHNGAVVLLHSTSQTNAAILDSLLTRWEEMCYSFGEISELFPAG
ncbi:polysaccharide deacetylase family protein, partial [uncultured Slackia sp.]|uniref:polysaccharide deacetylase family protein n=1 Tax=uncultured Slackia sp. TaxID=665903 RepID=UPI0026121E88